MLPPPLSPLLRFDDLAAHRLRDAGWRLVSTVGSASDFHELRPSPGSKPALWLHQLIRPAAVMGSRQRPEIVDQMYADTHGIEVCGRRSGGGLVVVEPERSLWLDVIVPPTHRLWLADVSRSFHWLGTLWADTLRELGETDVLVHEGPLLHPVEGQAVCFAGLGPGEVTVAGRKVVGLSQRRTKAGARFQCLLVEGWPWQLTQALLRPEFVPASLDIKRLEVGLPHPLDRQKALNQFLDGLHRLTFT